MTQSLSLEQLTNSAEAALIQGHLDHAEQFSRDVLARDPLSERAWLIAGAVKDEQGDEDTALLAFSKTIAVAPGWSLAYLTYSSHQMRAGRRESGKISAGRAFSLEPLNDNQYCIAASLSEPTGETDFARDTLARALCCSPASEQAWQLYADLIDRETSRPTAISPAHLFRRMVTCSPRSEKLRIHLGNWLLKLNPQHAIIEYRIAVILQPSNPKALYNLGLGLFQTGQTASTRWFRYSSQSDQAFADAHYNFANAMAAHHRPTDALSAIEMAVALQPNDHRYLTNRGNALLETRQLESAIRCLKRSIILKPTMAETYGNLGVAYQEHEQYDASIEAHDSALCLTPNWVDGYWNKSIALLLKGDWEYGWKLYEWRWQRETDPYLFKRKFEQPTWLGDTPIHGKPVLLHTEQGLGDNIQMARFVQLVAKKAGRVIVEAERPLVRLLSNISADIQVVQRGDKLPYFDLQCPFMSLPLVFKVTPENVPNDMPYLKATGASLLEWEQELGPKCKPRIGLMWRGGGNVKLMGRSIDLQELAPLLSHEFDWVSLQKDLPPEDEKTIRRLPALRYFGARQKDLLDAAAICALCDVVISVDTSIAHLAGAMGRPTWILLQRHADWRWLRHRTDSPWYPTAKLFRQTTAGDWRGVLSKIAEQLGRLTNENLPSTPH
jgi:tetratricopeptide (TPR) repeat protein